MKTLKIEVDYPYPSRVKSAVFLAVRRVPHSWDYLVLCKILAQLINESANHVEAWWFFTYLTLPDRELVDWIDNPRHRIGLHVVSDPVQEKALLEDRIGTKVSHFTIHGVTARNFLVWRRLHTPSVDGMSYFEDQYPSLDVLCRSHSAGEAVEIARQLPVLSFHPIWLLQNGTINKRGSYLEPLLKILEASA